MAPFASLLHAQFSRTLEFYIFINVHASPSALSRVSSRYGDECLSQDSRREVGDERRSVAPLPMWGADPRIAIDASWAPCCSHSPSATPRVEKMAAWPPLSLVHFESSAELGCSRSRRMLPDAAAHYAAARFAAARFAVARLSHHALVEA